MNDEVVLNGDNEKKWLIELEKEIEGQKMKIELLKRVERHSAPPFLTLFPPFSLHVASSEF